MKLGKNQLHMLAALGDPSRMLIVPCKLSRSLEKRGLVRSRAERTEGCFLQITAAGFRALADAHEAGAFDHIRPKHEDCLNPSPDLQGGGNG